MILPRNSNVITRERMINTRWTWAELHGPPLTKSFYFGSDGLIKVWSHRHEKSWAIEAGIVKIYDDGGKLMWSFDIALQFDGRLTLISKSPRHFPWDTYFCLTEYVPEARSGDAEFTPEDGGEGSGDNEGIRLVIWDLDDTFWHGTISETAVTVEPRNVEIVKELTRRGIINSICSKNDPDVVKTKLEELGVWENFVFPEISWNPKGAMLKNIVRNAQLRAETVMFIDDNETNLNEANTRTR